MTRAAIYARISQDDLGTEKGVGRQLDDARALAESRGWEVVDEYCDNDVSAYNGDRREQYQRLIADADAGRFDRIVVYHSSRLWRSRRERAEDLEVLAGKRISVAAVSGPELDLASASGRMLAGLLGEFDTAESAIKSERVQRAALQRAQEGRANGPVAYGWRREYDTNGDGVRVGFRDVEEPTEADVVREIVARLLAGDTLRGVADDLNGRGVPVPSRRPGTVWRHSTLRKLALRPANVALRVHRGEVIGPASWPAIVDADAHDRVVALLTSPSRRQRNDAARKHLLTYGLGECGVCGGPLRVSVRGNRQYGTPRALYICEDVGCVGRREESVDALVRDVVIGRLARPDAADVFAGQDDRRVELARRVDELRSRLNDAADQYADGTIDGQQMARISERLRPELETAERDYRRAGPATVDVPTELLGEHAADGWDALDVVRRKAVLEALGIRVIIDRQRPGPGFDPEAVRIEWTTP